MPVLKDPVCDAFSVPHMNRLNLTFPNLYDYVDVLYAENFEGVKPRG